MLRYYKGKFLIYLCFFVLVYMKGFSQLKTVMPPTPSPSAIGKYIDQPVGYYTGIPQVQIPLWSISLRNYTMPIFLSYHGGGIKVEEEATNVGLGWTLQAGGVVTRSVRDLPDDYNKGEVIKNDIYSDNPGLADEYPRVGRFWTGKYDALKDFDFSSTNATYTLDALNNIKSNYTAFPGTLHGNNDVEPDIFYFSFGNKSGKFVFDVLTNRQSACLIPYQDVIISHTLAANGEIATFTILDNDGTEYLFDKVERLKVISASQSDRSWTWWTGVGPNPSSSISNSSTTTEYNSSWYLSRVKTVLGEIITFAYEDESMLQFSRPGERIFKTTTTSGSSSSEVDLRDAASTESATIKRLSKIETDREIVNFSANHMRQDLFQPAHALTEIQVTSKATNEKIRSYDLAYSYFQSPTTETLEPYSPGFVVIPPLHSPVFYKRLRLDSLKERGKYNELNPPFIFGYDVTASLPHRFSYQQDLWGYFNGAATNTSLFPNLYVYPMYQGSERFRIYPTCNVYPGTDNFIREGGNRLPNPSTIGAGSLKRITYPTGGYTDYTYEPHTFLYDNCSYTGGGLRIKSIKNYTTINNLATEKSYTYLSANGNNLTSGRIISMPVFATIQGGTILLYTSSRAALGQTNGSIVGYQSITEKSTDGTTSNGSTRFEYSMPAIYGTANDSEYNLYNITEVRRMNKSEPQAPPVISMGLPNTAPFPPNPEYDWARGKLVKESYFSATDLLIEEKENTYKVYSAPGTKGSKNIYGLSYDHVINNPDLHQYLFSYSKYEYLANRTIVPDKMITKYYAVPNVLTRSQIFEYSEVGHMNPVKITVNESDGSERIKKYIYPHDYKMMVPLPVPQPIRNMQSRNLSAVSIEELEYVTRGGQQSLVSGNFIRFGTTDQFLPEKIYKVETSIPLNTFTESYPDPYRLIIDSSYKEYVSFNQYDIKGNILERSISSGPAEVFLWGYNSQYPVAKIVGVTYDTAKKYINQGVLDLATSDQTVRDEVNKARTGLPAALVTSYTYSPLIGITSETDPTGKTIFYEYDSFGRLKLLKDKDGKILKQVNYQYQQPITQ